MFASLCTEKTGDRQKGGGDRRASVDGKASSKIEKSHFVLIRDRTHVSLRACSCQGLRIQPRGRNQCSRTNSGLCLQATCFNLQNFARKCELMQRQMYSDANAQLTATKESMSQHPVVIALEERSRAAEMTVKGSQEQNRMLEQRLKELHDG